MFEHEKHLVGVYDNEHEAIQAVEDLKRRGYATEEISVIGRNHDEVDEINAATGTKTEEGLAAGATTGGVLGGLVGLLAGIGALAIPGIGPIVAAGPIAATLTGAAVGAGAGGLAGALIGMGIPEEEADRYQGYVKDGKILVVVERNKDRIGLDDYQESTVDEPPLTAGLDGTRSHNPVDPPFTGENPNDPRLGDRRTY